MITPRLRPRLDMNVPLTPADLVTRVTPRLGDPGAPCRGRATEEQIEIRIRAADHRFWSPQLVVIVKPRDAGSRLIGHFGPDAYVWAMFLGIYAFVVLSAVFGAFYGVAQLMIDESPWALWSIPIAVALVALIYTAAGIGQRLGHDQVDVLHEFLQDALRPPPDEPVP